MGFFRRSSRRSKVAIEKGPVPSAQQEEGPALFVPPGHYYSPVVNPEELDHEAFRDQTRRDSLLGVDLDFERFRAYFKEIGPYFRLVAFPDTQTDGFRYYFRNDFYSYGDALVLSAIIQRFKPSRIIEVGSGFSSAVVLDTLDRMPQGTATNVTFIDPYPERLKLLLRESDAKRVQIIETGIQSVPLIEFESLTAGDILFLDTTHISKTGSDVNHEVFELLPRLKPGVIIHFHDVFDNFEYPADWVLKDNRSWNEIYMLRAFLMFNNQFEVIYFNHAFARVCRDIVEQIEPRILRVPGGGLWLRRL